MPHRAMNTLGDLERAVMEQVWSAAEEGRTPVAVRDVHEALAATRGVAYTTVMTVMGRLADKGLLSQERSGRAYRYSAAGTRQELTAASMREQLAGMQGADRRAAMLHFLDDASPEEIADLKGALAQVEARQVEVPQGGAPKVSGTRRPQVRHR